MPLLVTLRMDGESFAFFEAARQAYFPPEINVVPAHLMLFHWLPGQERQKIEAALAAEAAVTKPLRVNIPKLQSLGRGVAYKAACPGLNALRGRLAEQFERWLTAQDRQGYRPHITVQNKVTSQQANETLAALQAGFTPFDVTGTGLSLWKYLNGPWELVADFPFRS